MSSPNSIEQQLAQLRDSFAARLPNRVAEIVQSWNSVQRNAWDPTTTKQFHRLLHTLAGSAATFGHREVSQTARQLEMIVQPFMESGAPPASEQIGLIGARLIALGDLTQTPTLSPLEPDCPAPAKIIVPEPEVNQSILIVQGRTTSSHLAEQIGCFGYTVNILHAVNDLPQSLAQHLPAALLIDTDHVEVNSKEFAKFHNKDGERLPLIFLSSRGDLTSRLSAVHVGADAYFTKPVNVSGLVDKLDGLIFRRVSDPYRILIIEDETWLADFYAVHLQKAGMQTHAVSDPQLVLQELRDWKPDLILMDVYMPHCSGLELAAVIRQQEAFVSIPIVYLSAETRLEQQLAALNLGGDDFLTKPIEPAHLVASVSARAERSCTLRSLILRDSLTGLFNHTALQGQLEVEIARAKRKKTMLAYAMLDLDHFKSINDTYGHPTGDGVLKTVARLLQQRLRKTDIIGRYGGEEFAVILPEADDMAAKQVLDEIRMGFSQLPQQSSNGEFSATFSGGVATWPRFGDSSGVSTAADRALYRAKQGGRNNVALA